MTQLFSSPIHGANETRRVKECSTLCINVVGQVIRDAVALGWREQEIALCLADACDDYVLYLATTPQKRWKAANEN